MFGRRLFVGASAAALAVRPVRAQTLAWPARPVRMIVNFGPGGSTDNAMRPFAERLSRNLGQQFVIENKGGASGALGMEAAIRSQEDGYTFLATPTLSMTILPHLRKLPFDPMKELVPVSQFTDSTLLVAVHPSVPVKTIPELVAYAKQNPGKLGWGTAGVGSQGHMICEALKKEAGIDILHVPYRGGGESLADFLAGNVQVHSDPNTMPHIASGKARLLAVLDRQRHPDYPDVPLLKEFYPPIDFYGWFGIYAPTGTPDSVVQRLVQELNRIAGEPDLIAQFRKLGLRPNVSSPQALEASTRKDFEYYGNLIRSLNLKME